MFDGVDLTNINQSWFQPLKDGNYSVGLTRTLLLWDKTGCKSFCYQIQVFLFLLMFIHQKIFYIYSDTFMNYSKWKQNVPQNLGKKDCVVLDVTDKNNIVILNEDCRNNNFTITCMTGSY